MERRRYSQAPEQFEYLLTEMGRDLSPTLVALTLWGDQWATASEPPILYTHEVCGGPVQSRLNCGARAAREWRHCVSLVVLRATKSSMPSRVRASPNSKARTGSVTAL